MNLYQRTNIITGWIIFLIAAFVYISTTEPTTSFWDCGEFIATAYKLEVGHPPGAPFFMLLGRIVSLFAADKTLVALCINTLSAIASAFTILFLFWTITALAKKIISRNGAEIPGEKIPSVIGSGIIGSLAYTFSDSFWFSAVEGEVYALSSLFTAVVFWAILKWENVAEEKYADRWLVLIAYLCGLSVGVHLLNLTALPAIAFVYYFKKFPVTRNGIIITGLISMILLGTIQVGVIQGVIILASKFELLFVNSFGLPFNSGIIFYILLLIALVIWGLHWSRKKNHPVVNTAILCFTVIVIGYSTFAVTVIRSLSNPPMDENNPENMFSLLAYLGREQYGDRPLLYGQHFNAPLDPSDPYKDGSPVYAPDKEKGIYVVTDDRKGSIPNYDPEYCTVLPRMWSDQGSHISAYKTWGEISGPKDKKPTSGQNLKFFFKYQVGWMYFRYFMWNFAGRQNDIQGHGGPTEGNWICGIPFIDKMQAGPQENLPESLANSKARNRFYLLPLILGLIGLIYHFRSENKGAFVVLILFIMTGLAIVVYLNQYPYQPRERDYAYVGSFYAFAIWIGLGVMAIAEWISSKIKIVPVMVPVIATIICSPVPAIMAKEGWDDHDRSMRYTARDFAANYLESCAPNAILFTNGDNDTFPLWYVQEVEGVRTDVRVVNLSLLNTDWYIDQMRRKAYDSDPVPFTLSPDRYRQGTRDFAPFYDRKLKGPVDLKDLMSFIGSDDPQAKLQTVSGKLINYYPSKSFRLPVDKKKVLENVQTQMMGEPQKPGQSLNKMLTRGNVQPQDTGKIVTSIEWTVRQNYLMKNDLMVLDLIAHNEWKRPVYFAITVGSEAYLQLEPYFQLEGLAYRLVPIRNESPDGQTGRVATDIMYDNLMNKFKWGNLTHPGFSLDENISRMTMNFRNNFARLANALIMEGKKDSAVAVLDKCMEVVPEKTVPYNFLILPIAEAYYRAGKHDKANPIIKRLAEVCEDDLDYYFTVGGEYEAHIAEDMQRSMSIMGRLSTVTKIYKQEELNKDLDERFKKLQARYMQTATAREQMAK
ncbi:MAG: DUF2723 domain-containing protein [Bacteroidetes bacterium]|nr:DUF2723 domain-containing protein [Bacteroidota bacterium]